MELARRNRWLALSLPVALAAAAALTRPAPPGVLAAGGAPGVGPCAQTRGLDHGGGSAWYRLDAMLDPDGTLAGRRLTAGRGSARWTIDLPPESFASGPVNGRLLVGDDDGQRSRLRMLDTGRGCWSSVATESNVIRSGLLTADATALYEHRVDRATRRDLGVWRREAAAPDTSRQVLAGLDADPVSGPTFSTALLADDDGRIAVSSCGERACRTRVLDPSTGAATMTSGTGPATGLLDGQLVALEACGGLPCAVEVVDLPSGVASSLGEAMGGGLPVSGGLVVLPGDHGLRVGHAGKADQLTDVPASAGLAPILRTSTSESGFEAPRGLLAVGPGGNAGDPSLVRLLNPVSLQMSAGEVLP